METKGQEIFLFFIDLIKRFVQFSLFVNCFLHICQLNIVVNFCLIVFYQMFIKSTCNSSVLPIT